MSGERLSPSGRRWRPRSSAGLFHVRHEPKDFSRRGLVLGLLCQHAHAPPSSPDLPSGSYLQVVALLLDAAALPMHPGPASAGPEGMRSGRGGCGRTSQAKRGSLRPPEPASRSAASGAPGRRSSNGAPDRRVRGAPSETSRDPQQRLKAWGAGRAEGGAEAVLAGGGLSSQPSFFIVRGILIPAPSPMEGAKS